MSDETCLADIICRAIFVSSMQLRSGPLQLGRLDIDTICTRCLFRLKKDALTARRRGFMSSSPRRSAKQPLRAQRTVFKREYFSANDSLGLNSVGIRSAVDPEPVLSRGTAVTTSEGPLGLSATRLQDKGLPNPRAISSSSDPTGTLPLQRRRDRPSTTDTEIPLDASSRLSTLSTTLPPTSLRRFLATYLSLSKPRLTFLIVLTTTTAYSLYPVPAVLLPTTTIAPSLSTLTLLFLTTGTTLCSASANALNMLLEPEHDAKMSRTRNRPIVRGLIGKRGALVFAGFTALVGVGSLYYGVNPTVAFLGGLNIFLYAGVYTPMKRISILNTWVGALVGGIPPLMGWTAAAGQCATGDGKWQELLFEEGSAGGWLWAALLFAWQFPHFNSLSWTIREEYKHAGFRMLAWTNTAMNGRVALRYSLLCFPICVGFWWYGITDQGFLITSSVANGWIVREAWRFWRMEGQKGTARRLFWASVWYLPVVMVLAMAQKQGLWQGVWRRIVGDEEEEEEVWVPEREGGERVEERPRIRVAPAVV